MYYSTGWSECLLLLLKSVTRVHPYAAKFFLIPGTVNLQYLHHVSWRSNK